MFCAKITEHWNHRENWIYGIRHGDKITKHWNHRENWIYGIRHGDKITKHWNRRENWIHGIRHGDNIAYKELWDGKLFAELRWFWDPQEE